MGRLVDLDNVKVNRLAPVLAAELAGRGSLTRDLDDVADVEVWRKAARKAGRILGRSVTTGATGTRVWVVDNDHEVTDGDLRQAGEAVSHAINRHRKR